MKSVLIAESGFHVVNFDSRMFMFLLSQRVFFINMMQLVYAWPALRS